MISGGQDALHARGPGHSRGRGRRSAIEHGDTVSPCEFLAWEGELFGRKVKVSVVEPEENTKLCGPAALNEIVVHKQNIMGIPRTSRWEEAFSEGVTTGIRYIDSFAALAAYEIEVATMAGKESETQSPDRAQPRRHKHQDPSSSGEVHHQLQAQDGPEGTGVHHGEERDPCEI